MKKIKDIFSGKKVWFFIYGGTLLVFVLYFVFFSSSNLRKRHELNKKIENLETSIANTKNSIENSYSYEQLKNDSAKLEQYGREKLQLQKKDEDVFIIVYE